LPDKVLEKFSDDNDSGYKEYHPRVIKKISPVMVKAQPAPVKPRIIQVPVPIYDADYDSMYRNVGTYNPAPIRRKNNSPSRYQDINTIPSAPLPSKDNDAYRDYWN